MLNAFRYFIVFSSIIFLSLNNVANAQTIGVAVSIDDRVSSNKQSRLKSDSPIFRNERLRTNNSGLGQFKFSDGTKMVMGPGSRLTLDKLIYNPGGKTFKNFVLDTTAGAVRVISGKSKSSAYEINTPVGTLGIRGTAFDMRHYRGNTYVMVLKGAVTVCSNGGECQTLRRKCSLCVINRSGNVSDPVVPRNSNFDQGSIDTFFPFVADQSRLEREFRVRFLQRCRVGITPSSYSGGGDGPDPDASPDPSPSPSPSPDPSPSPAADPSPTGGDDAGDDGGDDAGDDGGDTGDTAGDNGDTGDAGEGNGGEGEGNG